MYVESLALENFRNYEHLSIELSPGINIFYGDNAQGKTNILEALYMCATTRSHRGSKDKEMLRFSQDEAHMRLILSKDDIRHKIDMHLKRNKAKGIAIDGIPIKKSGELFGMIHMICFSPEDLSLIKDGPGERRHFLDMALCQLSRIYLHQLSEYNKIVNQRNSLLKQMGYNPSLKDTLDIWDMHLVNYGSQIIQTRKTFVEEINACMQPIHAKLTGQKEHIVVEYQPSVSADAFEEKLMMHREKDMQMRTTGVGPHRDDLVFKVQNIDIRKYGSQGQQRTAALSLKLAEIELVRQKIKDTPVLLLDDVLSELDSSRQNYLLNCISEIQTVMTCTGLEEFVKNRLNIDRIFKVTDGTVDLMR